MDYKGAAFFDYDGTLADESNNIYLPTETTRETIKKLKSKGFAIFLSTGRSKCYIPDIEGMFDGYVAANGAYCELGGKVIEAVTIPDDKVLMLIDEFNKLKIEFSFEDQTSLYVRDKNSQTFIKMLNKFNIPLNIMKPLEERKDVCKGIVIFDSEEQFKLLKELFKGEFVFDRHRYNSADVTIFGVNKGTGVRAVIERLGIPYENTYAFGDGTNDIEMLKAVKHGVAMGVHSEGVREAAEYLTDTVKNEGITKAFEHYGVI